MPRHGPTWTVVECQHVQRARYSGDSEVATPSMEFGRSEVATSRRRKMLTLPLRRHHLGVGSRDLDTGVETSLVVRLDDVALHNLSSPDTTVVRSLGCWETVLGPSVWASAQVEESVLLLETLSPQSQ